MIAGITRVRNESLIIADTLTHYLQWCDRIYLYDDCSEDETAAIAEGFDRVEVVMGDYWRPNRRPEETRHRKMMLDLASRHEWALCFDADERLVGELPDMTADGYTFRLFDGYLTASTPDHTEGPLIDAPRMWGPEYRDILMLFRTAHAEYVGDGNRCPRLRGRIDRAPMLVKHYGKCISRQQWEDTCAYYTGPSWTPKYRDKWEARKGKAEHTESDFGRPLYSWDELMRKEDQWKRL